MFRYSFLQNFADTLFKWVLYVDAKERPGILDILFNIARGWRML